MSRPQPSLRPPSRDATGATSVRHPLTPAPVPATSSNMAPLAPSEHQFVDSKRHETDKKYLKEWPHISDITQRPCQDRSGSVPAAEAPLFRHMTLIRSTHRDQTVRRKSHPEARHRCARGDTGSLRFGRHFGHVAVLLGCDRRLLVTPQRKRGLVTHRAWAGRGGWLGTRVGCGWRAWVLESRCRPPHRRHVDGLR